MKKPIIGILANLHRYDTGFLPHVDLCGLQRDYLTAIETAEGVPLILPVVADTDIIEQQLELVDAIVLPGGYDVSPCYYKEEPSCLLEEIHPERDAYEFAVIKIAEKLQKPLLGICRGLQILNVAYGGSLYQDISHAPGASVKHRQMAKRYDPTHSVDIAKNTLLHEIFGTTTIMTNSFHHQAIKQLAPGFIVNAQAKDGIIEGIEKPGDRFVLALQWHPEMMAAKDACMQSLFREFVRRIKKVSGK